VPRYQPTERFQLRKDGLRVTWHQGALQTPAVASPIRSQYTFQNTFQNDSGSTCNIGI
jgi:hypothetical protein